MLANIKKDLKKKTRSRVEALSMKEKIKIQERINRWESRIAER
jgi:hypothetical protein